MPSRSAKKVSSCGKAEAVDRMNFETRMKLNQRDLPSMSIQFQWHKKMENRWYCCILRKKSRNNNGLTYCYFSKYQALFLLICHVKWIAIAGQIYSLSLLHFSFFDFEQYSKICSSRREVLIFSFIQSNFSQCYNFYTTWMYKVPGQIVSFTMWNNSDNHLDLHDYNWKQNDWNNKE